MNSRKVNRIKAGIHHGPSWLNWAGKRFPPLVIAVGWLVITIDNLLPYAGKKYFASALNRILRLPKSYVSSIQFILAKALFLPVALLFFVFILIPYRFALGRSRVFFPKPEPSEPLNPAEWRHF